MVQRSGTDRVGIDVYKRQVKVCAELVCGQAQDAGQLFIFPEGVIHRVTVIQRHKTIFPLNPRLKRDLKTCGGNREVLARVRKVRALRDIRIDKILIPLDAIFNVRCV